MRYAEFTGSRTKPFPTHSPWSGGSNSAPKLVRSLSRLLVPLKLRSNVALGPLAVGAAAGGVVPAAALPAEPVGPNRCALLLRDGVTLGLVGVSRTPGATRCTPVM